MNADYHLLGSTNNAKTATDAVNSWNNEKANYVCSNNSCKSGKVVCTCLHTNNIKGKGGNK